MSTKSKPPTSPPTQVPVARRGAPLPLVTQPMAPLEDDSGQTRVDALQATANIAFGKPTIAMTAQQREMVHGAATPEIGLTQHHLPDEPPADVVSSRRHPGRSSTTEDRPILSTYESDKEGRQDGADDPTGRHGA